MVPHLKYALTDCLLKFQYKPSSLQQYAMELYVSAKIGWETFGLLGFHTGIPVHVARCVVNIHFGYA